MPAVPGRGARERAPVRPAVPPALVEACRRGDRDAFGALFDCCRDRVYSIALHHTGDPSAAADVTQDVFLRLFSRIGQFRGDCAFTTWLFRIVVNAALDHRRARRRLAPLDEAAPRAVLPAVQVVRLEQQERSAHVRAALATLRPRLRIALVMRYVEGLSYDEIAAVLGSSPGTVASRLSRAHAAFARALARRQDVP